MENKTDLYELMNVTLMTFLNRIVNKKSDIEHEEMEEDDFDDMDECDMDEESDCAYIEEDNWKYKLLQFLTTESESDDVFDIVEKKFGYSFVEDKTVYKQIMMLIIASKTYCGIMYDINRKITDIDEEIVSFYAKPLNYQDIINLFQNAMLDGEDLALVIKLLDCSLNYASGDDSYLYIAHVLDFIKNSGGFSKLLKINPFEILHFMGIWSMDELLESESIIQTLWNCYDYVQCIQEETTEVDRMQLFLAKLADYCNHDMDTMNSIMKYVLGNVYENCCLDSDNEEQKKLADLIEREATDIDKFIDYLKTDVDLFWTIMDQFYSFNDCLDPDDLYEIRGKFLSQNGNVKVLKKLNPFYEQEQRHFAEDYD